MIIYKYFCQSSKKYETIKQQICKMKKSMKSHKQLEVWKKLKGIHNEKQLKSIGHDLQQQNHKLLQQIKQLRNQVLALTEKRKNQQKSKNTQANQLLQSQINTKKQEVSKKYIEMNTLKKQLQNIQLPDEDVSNSQANNLNKLTNVENNIQTYKEKIQDLKKERKYLEETLSTIQAQQNNLIPKIKPLEQQNVTLKKKITDLRRVSQDKLYESVKVQDKLTTFKHQIKEVNLMTLRDAKNIKTDQKSLLLMQKQLTEDVSVIKSKLPQ